MPVIGCLEIFQNGRSPQPITGIIYSPGRHELKIGSAAEDTLGFIPLVLNDTYRVNAGGTTLSEPPPPGAKWHVQSRCRRDQNSNTLSGQISTDLTSQLDFSCCS